MRPVDQIRFTVSRGEEMNKKNNILEAATRSFSMFGYKATTIEQVAKLAKVGKGTVYNFYDNKEQLLKESVLLMIDEMKKETENNFDPSISFMENVHQSIIRLLKYREQHLLFAKLLEEERQLQTPEVIEMISSINREIVNYISEKLGLAVERGEIRPCNVEVVAFVFLKSYLALVVDWQMTYSEPLTEQEIAEVIHQTIISGLSK